MPPNEKQMKLEKNYKSLHYIKIINKTKDKQKNLDLENMIVIYKIINKKWKKNINLSLLFLLRVKFSNILLLTNNQYNIIKLNKTEKEIK